MPLASAGVWFDDATLAASPATSRRVPRAELADPPWQYAGADQAMAWVVPPTTIQRRPWQPAGEALALVLPSADQLGIGPTAWLEAIAAAPRRRAWRPAGDETETPLPGDLPGLPWGWERATDSYRTARVSRRPVNDDGWPPAPPVSFLPQLNAGRDEGDWRPSRRSWRPAGATEGPPATAGALPWLGETPAGNRPRAVALRLAGADSETPPAIVAAAALGAEIALLAELYVPVGECPPRRPGWRAIETTTDAPTASAALPWCETATDARRQRPVAWWAGEQPSEPALVAWTDHTPLWLAALTAPGELVRQPARRRNAEQPDNAALCWQALAAAEGLAWGPWGEQSPARLAGPRARIAENGGALAVDLADALTVPVVPETVSVATIARRTWRPSIETAEPSWLAAGLIVVAGPFVCVAGALWQAGAVEGQAETT